MKRAVIVFIILMLNLIFQSTVLQCFRFNSVIPNTAFAIIIPIYELAQKKLRDRIFATLVGGAIVVISFTIFNTHNKSQIKIIANINPSFLFLTFTCSSSTFIVSLLKDFLYYNKV